MIQMTSISKSFARNASGKIAGGAPSVRALSNVSLKIGEGEFVAIVGPSGSGKSTLMNILGLIDTADSGSYTLAGKEVANLDLDTLASIRNKRIGFVFQQFHLLPRTPAVENVQLPLIYSDRQSIEGLAEKALAMVGLDDRIEHTPEELSGGQQQRVAIARALINDPDLILADEPTGNLDSQSGRDVLKIFHDLNADGRTIILITHDAAIAASAGRVLRIVDGTIVDEIVNTSTTTRQAQEENR